jgi:hypothetical protein
MARTSQNPFMLLAFMMAIILIHSTPGVDGRVPFSPGLAQFRTQPNTMQRNTIKSLSARGGATLASPEDQDEDAEEDNLRRHPDFAKLQSYRMRQQVLLQLRAALLSEALAKRGVPLPSLTDASTPEGKASPKKVDWECAESTKEKEIVCMFTFDSEPGTKLIAPVDPKNVSSVPKDSEWVTVVALNRLRRNDVSKVESMWHNKNAIMDSWFRADSEYSLLQHVGPKGILLNVLLHESVLTLVVGLSMLVLLVAFMPVWEAVINRFLVSGLLWSRWISWGRFVHMGLPFKLLIGQWLLNVATKGFKNVKGKIKDRLVEMECEILDRSLPLTMGVPTPDHVEVGDAEILQEEEEIIEHLVEEQDANDGDDDDTRMRNQTTTNSQL